MSASVTTTRPGVDAKNLAERYTQVRHTTTEVCRSLTAEDQMVQSMPDASPTKWHLAHTTWFFEAMVLQAHDPDYRVFDPHYAYLFNSYYESMGPRHARPKRGLLTRPTLAQVHSYRDHVDRALDNLLARGADPAVCSLIELGCHHEQQHQELLLTDILNLFAENPLHPAYMPVRGEVHTNAAHQPLTYTHYTGGVV
jgi:hypothetical protein